LFPILTNAEIAQEIVSYLKREHQYGNKVTGKQIAETILGARPMVGSRRSPTRLAVLFRAGSIVVTYQGDPTGATRTGAAGLLLQQCLPRGKLRTARVNRPEDINHSCQDRRGDGRSGSLDVEEGAIAEAFKKLARTEKDAVLTSVGHCSGYRLPVP